MKGGNNNNARSSMALFLAVAVAAVLLTQQAGAVICDPTSLRSCEMAILGTESPSTACCDALEEQVPCFCEYMDDPLYAPYVNSTRAAVVAAECDVSIPADCAGVCR